MADLGAAVSRCLLITRLGNVDADVLGPDRMVDRERLCLDRGIDLSMSCLG